MAMKRVVAAVLMVFAAPAWAEVAGVIDFVSGAASVRSADGAARQASRGAQVHSGEAIETDSGRVQLRMVDGAYISLQPKTSLKFDDYRYKGQTDGSERGIMSLLKGGLRTITGAIGKGRRDLYQLNTVVATIGIRGTEFAVEYGNSITVKVGEGLVAVCNDGGCLDVAGGQSAHVGDRQTRPVLTTRTVSLPPPPATREETFRGDESRRGEGESAVVLEELVHQGSAPPVVVPLPTGVYGASIGVANGSANFAAGLLGGTATFDPAGRMTAFADGSGSFGFTGGAVSDFGADGVIAWGRWSSGGTTGATIPGPLTSLHYVVGTGPSPGVLNGIARGYTSFASTAPTAQLAGVVTAGAPNSVTGNLTVSFAAGTVGYNLNIPVAGFTFTMNGTATFVNNSPGSGDTRFLGGGTINGTGGSCAPCTGIVPFGPNIQGFILGGSGERAGVNYGFTSSSAGIVNGAVAFQ